jgi:ArsR family transcriptional regulator, arsenate/arsenite/antimonite-responsive transcriptional repressor / arsenate reductase (thioredoxin)
VNRAGLGSHTLLGKTMKLTESHVIEIFKALSDPNRMQIFQLLLLSDRTNSELMEATGLRQNLLSHHLNILTECGLIEMRRSIGDARRHYYTPQFHMVHACRDWWAVRSAPALSALPALQKPQRVLFLCLRNGARSFIAEALGRTIGSDMLIVDSAGIETPIPDLEYGLKVLAEHQINMDGFQPKTYEAVVGQTFDYVITVCDIVHEREIPAEFESATVIHWSLPDPLEIESDDAARLAATHQLYDEIALRLANFVQQLALAENTSA